MNTFNQYEKYIYDIKSLVCFAQVCINVVMAGIEREEGDELRILHQCLVSFILSLQIN